MRRRQLYGFTLLELLIVIAIMAALAALLFPVFAQAREKARQTACLSHLKQIAAATLMYAEDYDDTLLWNPQPGGLPRSHYDAIVAIDGNGRTSYPFRNQGCADQPSTSFIVLLQPYMRSLDVLRCPSFPGYPRKLHVGYAASLDPAIYPPVGYGINPSLLGSACRPRTLASISPSPGEIVLFADSERLWNYAHARDDSGRVTPFWTWMEAKHGRPHYIQGAPRHGGGLNFAYADGHAQSGHPTPLPAADWGVYRGYYRSAKLD